MGLRGPQGARPVIRKIEGEFVICKMCGGKCGEYRPLFTDYHVHKNGDAFGYYSQCKICYADKRREQYREYNRTRRKDREKEVALIYERVNYKIKNE
jgi:hypothetical protein